MYEDFYGLRERPFELTANPRFLFMTPGHREALSTLEYGLFSAKALTVLIGEAGTGKTTLLQAALLSERCKTVRCIHISNPALTRQEFVERLADGFQVAGPATRSKTALLREIEAVLRERRQHGEITALMVDEAQSLGIELLEEIRLLGNIETHDQKLLPLVLAGQPELGHRLDDPALRQLKQRVALRCTLSPLELTETGAYIASRIRTAGGEPSRLFTRESVTLIHEYSSGIPRTISVLCDNALMNGLALDRRPVDRAVVQEVCDELVLNRRGSGTPTVSSQPPRDASGRFREQVATVDESDSPRTSEGRIARLRRFTSFGSGRS
jgi:type II secretory pathway predicted ATPase ExeA